MTTRAGRLVIALGLLLAACESDSGPSCNLSGGTQLAPPPETTPIASGSPTPAITSSWPKFRADVANSGRTAVDLTASRGVQADLLFDGYCSVADTQTTTVCTIGGPTRCPAGQPCVRIGTTETTPIVAQIGVTELVYVASSDGTVYAPEPPPTPFVEPIQIPGGIVGSPLIGADGTLFVPGNGQLIQFITNGTEQNNGTTKNGTSLSGFVTASPNIWNHDGTVFVGSQTGNFPAICPNGVPRFVATVPANPSTAVVVQDPNQPTVVTPIIVVGGINGQVRAYNLAGNQYWSFFASASITAALLVDLSADPNALYVADTGGRVFRVNLENGQLLDGFNASREIGGITASPALGRDTAAVPKLYVADQAGVLHALDRTTGGTCWTFDAGGPISSSPAVATGGDHDVIVVAADIYESLAPGEPPVLVGGKISAVRDDDDGACAGGSREAMWTVFPGAREGHELGYAIGASSPAIAANGTVYIGRQGTRLGRPDRECPTPETTPGTTPTPEPCTVNEAGALYGIDP
jgi:outer membrane protein assembly factor BamB